jgi:two-component system nitrogen regulation sensor histidine kinase GlnL
MVSRSPKPLANNKPAIHGVADSDNVNLALINKHLFTAILWADAHGHIAWANIQAEQLFSASQARLRGRSVFELLRPYSKNPVPSNDVPRNNVRANNVPSNNVRANNANRVATLPMANFPPLLPHQQTTDPLPTQFRHALVYQQPFMDHDQHIFGLSHSVLVDYSVTPVDHDGEDYFLIELWEKNRQSRISQEQRQQEQHAIARQMLRAVAHEVKNPLAGIRGAAQLLSKQLDKLSIIDRSIDSKISTYAGIIISETDRLTHLIGQMLGSNRLANWQSVNIHEPLEHVITLTHSQHPDIIIERDYDLSLPELTADKDQLIQVFLNLINNACEAMLEQEQTPDYVPKITLQTRVAFQHTIGSVQHKQVLKIDIHDNGGGIDPTMVGQIFLPLVTGRANGTGLGLALVQDMISRHQGSIDVVSSAGHTTFTVYLPFSQ